MSLTAASGFILLFIPVVQGWDDWGVSYTRTDLCVSEGSTVELNCSYTHPQPGYGEIYIAEKSFWFTKETYRTYVDPTTDSKYTGRVTSTCHEKRCSLRITDVKKSDSAKYKFRIITEQPDGRFTGLPGVTLTVTDLWVSKSSRAILKCVNSCPLHSYPSYVWYKNGVKLQGQTSASLKFDSNYENSYSCALYKLEDFPSPPFCDSKDWCNSVTYSNRRACAPKGSSVEISCSYYSYYRITSKSWTRPGLNGEWQSLSHVPDRVHVRDENRRSVLTISKLTENDSAEYRFRFTGYPGWGDDLPGTTLTVAELQVQVGRITAGDSYAEVELRCHSSCGPADRFSYAWFRDGVKLTWEETSSYTTWIPVKHKISCAFKGHERFPSPSVYAPQPPSVSVSPPGETVEGSPVTLNCSADANPAASYTWYKKNKDPDSEPFRKGPQLVFSSIQSSDSGEYYCEAENELGKTQPERLTIDVKYAPRTLSVSVSPPGEVLEGSSVTLNCGSDANPAASHTWHKKIHGPPLGQQGFYHIASISSEDGGSYFCSSGNQYGRINSSVFIDVHYPPRRTSVSVSHSDPMMEGDSVTLNCSTDANPAASYTWYKTGEPTPKGSGPVFTISDVRVEDSGHYFCEARNSRGPHNSTSHLVTVFRSMKSVTAGTISALFLLIVFILVVLFIWKKKSSKETSRPTGRADNNSQVNASSPSQPAEEQGDLSYASVRFSNHQDEPVYSNISSAPKRNKRKKEEEEEDVDYTVINFESNGPSPRSNTRGADDDSAAVYSTVMKTRRV